MLLAECKVLSLPYDSRRIRNIKLKLNPTDSESYRSKLRAKTVWIRKIARQLAPGYQGVQGAVVLDRYFPGSLDTDMEWVVDLARLDKALSQLLATA